MVRMEPEEAKRRIKLRLEDGSIGVTLFNTELKPEMLSLFGKLPSSAEWLIFLSENKWASEVKINEAEASLKKRTARAVRSENMSAQDLANGAAVLAAKAKNLSEKDLTEAEKAFLGMARQRKEGTVRELAVFHGFSISKTGELVIMLLHGGLLEAKHYRRKPNPELPEEEKLQLAQLLCAAHNEKPCLFRADATLDADATLNAFKQKLAEHSLPMPTNNDMAAIAQLKNGAVRNLVLRGNTYRVERADNELNIYEKPLLRNAPLAYMLRVAHGTPLASIVKVMGLDITSVRLGQIINATNRRIRGAETT